MQKQPSQRFLATLLHRRRQPELLEIPVEVAQVADRREVLAGRNSAFVVDHAAGSSRVTLHLRRLRFLRLRDQTVHVDIDRRLEEAGIAAVVVLDRGVTRIVVDHLRQLGVARMIDIEFLWIG